MPKLERIQVTRIVAKAQALDSACWRAGSIVLRSAPDEALLMPPDPAISLADPHAIVVQDGGFAGVWLSAAETQRVFERLCEWEPPLQRPAFAQGTIAGIATKVWLDTERALFVIPAPMLVDFETRLATVVHG